MIQIIGARMQIPIFFLDFFVLHGLRDVDLDDALEEVICVCDEIPIQV